MQGSFGEMMQILPKINQINFIMDPSRVILLCYLLTKKVSLKFKLKNSDAAFGQNEVVSVVSISSAGIQA